VSKPLPYLKKQFSKLARLSFSSVSLPQLSKKQVGIIAASLGFVALLTIIIVIPRLQADLVSPPTSKEQFEIENAARTALVQTIGGLFLFITAFISWRNYQIAQDKQSSERFSKAIEQLDSDRYTVCLGGLFSLEKLAKDSPKDYWTVIEILTSFVREKALTVDESELQNSKATSSIRAALTIIGRRNTNLDPKNEFPDLSNINFSGIDLKGIFLHAVNLSYASFSCADLQGADLSHCFLYKANFSKANLKKANLSYSSIQSADFSDTNLCDTNFNNTSSEDGIIENVGRISAINFKTIGEKRGKNLLVEPTLFKGANLSFSSFSNVTLSSSADFSGANLSETRFENANLTHANFIEANLYCTKFDNTNLSGADFTKAKLYNADFNWANLDESIFVEASTEYSGHKLYSYGLKKGDGVRIIPTTIFYQSSLNQADFSGANFINADFINSDLDKAKLSNTTLPATE
jgi:uncharacterized protein YjbI with pentapeptide repeats